MRFFTIVQKEFKEVSVGSSLVVQWLRLQVLNAECSSSIPGQESRFPHATNKSSNAQAATKDPACRNND